MVSDEADSPGDPDSSTDPEDPPEPEADQDEADWDEGIEDTPEVEEAWDSVVGDSPEHAGGEDLGDRIEHDVSRGAVQRALGVVSAVLLVVLALALVVAMLRHDSGEESDEVDDRPEVSTAPPPSIPDDADDVVINPVADPDYTTALDEIIALEEGDGPEGERIVLEVDDRDLPAPAGTVNATLIFFDGTPQVLMTGPTRWLNSACIQTTVATAELEAIDAGYHDTPTGECGAEGIGRQSQISCIGDDVIMLDIDLVDEGATSGSDRLVADSVRVALVDFPADFEKVSVLGTISVSEEFSVSDLPLARAARGSELTVTFPTPDGEVDVTCLTR